MATRGLYSKCEGLHNKPCTKERCDASVKLCQGDLMLCPECKEARFPGNKNSSASSDPGLADKNETNPKDTSQLDLPTKGAISRERVLIQPVLSYILFSMQSASADNIKLSVLGHFSDSAICEAKDMLWSFCGTKIIGDKKSRKGSSVRPEKEAHISDIITDLAKLDKANKVPWVVIDAFSLDAIPRSHPEELNNISLCDRLNQLECLMKRMQEQIDHHKAQNIDIQDKLHRHSSNANVVSTVKVVAPKEDPNDNNKDNYKDTYKHKSDSENLNLMIQD